MTLVRVCHLSNGIAVVPASQVIGGLRDDPYKVFF